MSTTNECSTNTESLTQAEQSFNWSIDDIAQLNPCEFSNYDEIEVFREIEEEHLSHKLNLESEHFFSQNQIIPSPQTPKASSQPILKSLNTRSFIKQISKFCSNSDSKCDSTCSMSSSTSSATPRKKNLNNSRKRLNFCDVSDSEEYRKQVKLSNSINLSICSSNSTNAQRSPNFPNEIGLFSPIVNKKADLSISLENEFQMEYEPMSLSISIQQPPDSTMSIESMPQTPKSTSNSHFLVSSTPF